MKAKALYQPYKVRALPGWHFKKHLLRATFHFSSKYYEPHFSRFQAPAWKRASLIIVVHVHENFMFGNPAKLPRLDQSHPIFHLLSAPGAGETRVKRLIR